MLFTTLRRFWRNHLQPINPKRLTYTEAYAWDEGKAAAEMYEPCRPTHTGRLRRCWISGYQSVLDGEHRQW